MRIADANTHARHEAEGEMEGVTNYYFGSRAIVGLKHYSAVQSEAFVRGSIFSIMEADPILSFIW